MNPPVVDQRESFRLAQVRSKTELSNPRSNVTSSGSFNRTKPRGLAHCKKESEKGDSSLSGVDQDE